MTATVGRTAAATPPPPPVPGPAEEPPITQDGRRRLRLFAVSVVLTVLAFVQTPGRIAPDTKLDLSVDPLGFLTRAWYLWEPLGASGQLQNQAYGYFLPMGPFHVVGHLLGLPAWMVQRAWWAFVLLVAFHGLYRLLGRLEVGTPNTQMIAALAYALSPRMITELGPVSIEAWPIAMAPWVLLPLVRVTPGAEVTAAARSGIAIALCGGVNAVAVGAVLPLPVWWLITRKASPMRRKLARWWALAALCGMSWWLGPLLMLGRYSPPFLDWVEAAEASTSKASLPSAFRGVTQWVAWFRLPEPIWPAGWSALASPAGIILGWLLIAVAVLGLLRRDTPHRIFLIGGSVAGLVLLTMGHVGPMSPPWAPFVRDFLDGAGAPLRNSHKFDLVLRLPLAIGLAHALTVLRLPQVRGIRVSSGTALKFTVACAVLGTAAPALLGQIPARGSFEEVPPYWKQAADWLEANDDGGRTLVVPGQPSAESTWGDPTDEPFQPLARSRWAVRDSVPLSSAGNIRMLTVVEQQLATGRGSPGLAEFLARAGVSRLLVRADLQRSFRAGAAPLPAVTRSALHQSPGLSPVVSFGPDMQGRRTDTEVVDDGLDIPVPALEVWQVDQPTALAEVYDAASTLRVDGGTESLLSLADAGVLGRRPTVMAGDPQAEQYQDAPLALTDTPHKREANVSQVRDLYSDVMTEDQEYERDRAVHDWLPFEQPLTTVRMEGVESVEALSSASSALGPWHAIDGDTSTAWVSERLAVGQWLEVRFPRPVQMPSSITVIPSSAGARLARLDVRTDNGTERTEIRQDANLQTAPQQIKVAAGYTRSMRITVAGTWQGTELDPVAISEIQLPEVTPARMLTVPPVDTTPVTISLQSPRDGADSCVTVADRSWCSPRLSRQSEEGTLDRLVTLPESAGYTVTGTARARSTGAVDALLRPDRPFVQVSASSRRSNDPAQRPQAAMDRSLGTAWTASSTDQRPTLRLRWSGERTVNRLRWHVDPQLPASRPARLEIIGPGGRRVVTPNEDGWVRFSPLRGDRLDVVVRGVDPVVSVDRATMFPTTLPVGVSELEVPALDDLRRRIPDWRPVVLPCGNGPLLQLGGQLVPTRVVGTAGDVVRRTPMQVQPCSAVQPLPAGDVRIKMVKTAHLEPENLTLTRTVTEQDFGNLPATTLPARIRQFDPERRLISVPASAGEQILVVHENINSGWKASLDGRQLAAVRIDGWQQGFVVPAGSGGDVRLHFTPGTPYRIIMLSGIVIVTLLALFTMPPRGRRATGGQRAARLAEPVSLPENTRRRGYGVLGAVGIVAIGGGWAVAALVGVLIAIRRRVQMRWIVAVACAVAGIGAAVSTNADIPTPPESYFGVMSIGAALVVIACMVVRVDADSDRILTRASLMVARMFRRRR